MVGMSVEASSFQFANYTIANLDFGAGNGKNCLNITFDYGYFGQGSDSWSYPKQICGSAVTLSKIQPK